MPRHEASSAACTSEKGSYTYKGVLAMSTEHNKVLTRRATEEGLNQSKHGTTSTNWACCTNLASSLLCSVSSFLQVLHQGWV